MKLLRISAFAGICIVHSAIAMDNSEIIAKYCRYSPNGYCYWCQPAYDDIQQPGNCKAGYAGCVKGEVILKGGQTVNAYDPGTYSTTHNYKCSSYGGFCRADCDDVYIEPYWASREGFEEYGIEFLFEMNPYSCHCEAQYTQTMRCADGYYGTPDRISYLGCTKCPSAIGADGKEVPAHSEPGNNANITDCKISSGVEFNDGSGTYVYTQDCHYSEN